MASGLTQDEAERLVEIMMESRLRQGYTEEGADGA